MKPIVHNFEIFDMLLNAEIDYYDSKFAQKALVKITNSNADIVSIYDKEDLEQMRNLLDMVIADMEEMETTARQVS